MRCACLILLDPCLFDQVIGASRFTAALREAIADPQIRHLPLTGAIDQFTDSTDAIGRLGFLRVCARAAIQES
jgi:hypothetical protein